MKLHSPLSFFLFVHLQALTKVAASAAGAAGTAAFRPQRISIHDLISSDDSFGSSNESFMKALTEVGMVSVTGIFSDTEESRRVKKDTFAWLHECAIVESKVDHGLTKTHTYEDGTVRRTLPTHSTPEGIQPFPFTDNDNSSDSCKEFSKSSYEFRTKVAEATSAFAKRLAAALGQKCTDDKPMLVTENGNGFHTVAEVVEGGEHLEHFHSYQKKPDHDDTSSDETIEWHVDQGIFLVFTPGRKLHCHDKSMEPKFTKGFYIQKEDGSQAQVEFDEHDDLVFMLGDGVNQYVNQKRQESTRNSKESLLRAVPHSLTMSNLEEDEARVWYGRMVLPPSEAIHPAHGITFGELRQRVIQGAINHGSDDEALVLGCSSELVARDLQEESLNCAADELVCWHACMSIPKYNVSDEICQNRGLVMNCTNPRGQMWDGNHGDFYPGCVEADAEIATPYPTLPNYPRDNVTCTDTVFQEYASNSSGYEYEFDLPYRPDGSSAKLMWSVVGGEVHGKVVFNGIFGWLAFGFANPTGEKNGMHGGHVIMALPGGNYSAVTGLDMDLEPTIDEYMISEDKWESAFRHWQSPISSTMRTLSGSASVDYDSCNTALTFNSSSIGGIPFNVSGEDDLMWAANNVDYFAGYHGGSRGRFFINWAQGSGRSWIAPSLAPTTASADPPSGATDVDDHGGEPHGETAPAPTPTATSPTSSSTSSASFCYSFCKTKFVGLMATVVAAMVIF